MWSGLWCFQFFLIYLYFGTQNVQKISWQCVNKYNNCVIRIKNNNNKAFPCTLLVRQRNCHSQISQTMLHADSADICVCKWVQAMATSDLNPNSDKGMHIWSINTDRCIQTAAHTLWHCITHLQALFFFAEFVPPTFT